MPFKRPDPPSRVSPSGYSSPSDHEDTVFSKRSKVSRSAKAFPDVKVYIVQAKLNSPAIVELFTLAERNCKQLCRDVEDADVVVTAISMKKRLERHIPWDVAKTKAIVTPDWLKDSVKAGHPLPCGSYTAIQDLHEETVEHCPECNMKPCECQDSDETLRSPLNSPLSDVVKHSPPSSPTPSFDAPPGDLKKPSTSKSSTESPSSTVVIPAYLLPPPVPIPTNLSRLSYSAKYACQRASPLVCPNQALAVELDIIKRSRALEGEDRSALSYARAIASIKAYPRRITSKKQVEKLPYLGVKILGLIEEYIDAGGIFESQTIRDSTRFQALSIFSTVYGIGPTTARRLYSLGLRTLQDLEIYYAVDPSELKNEKEFVEIEKENQPSWKERSDDLGESWIKVALGLREDLSLKIPRDEVEEMGCVVMRELDQIEPGCTSTIVGGYRRGKPESNDVDIVFTHPDPSKVKGLCKRLVKRLYEGGMVSHVMHLSGFHGHNPLRTTHWDSLEKSLTVFILPPSSSHYRGIRRRLDLIFAKPEVYWCAVIGWSGSVMFQRDLRKYAKEKFGMKFDSSGIVRRYDSKQFFPKTEKAVFDLFGLEWVEPIWRNADV